MSLIRFYSDVDSQKGVICMSDIINEISVSIEEVLKSDPNIRHLLDVACPLYFKGKLKIKAVLIICRSYFIRKTIVDLLKLKLDIQAFNYLDLDFEVCEGDVVSRITQTPEKGFLLCEETELKLSASVRKLLARIIENSSFDMRIGKGVAAKSINLALPDITFVFSCEQKTPATDFLAKYCDYVIILDDYRVEELCELLIAASFNEKKIKCSPEIIKSIALKNKNDVDFCLRSVLRISQFMELQESADRTLTRSILEKVEDNIYHTFTLEYIRELKQINIVGRKLIRLFEENESAFEKMEFSEIMDLLYGMMKLVAETTEELKSISSNNHFN